MPITLKQLKETCPSPEGQRQLVDFAQLLKESFSQQIAESVQNFSVTIARSVQPVMENLAQAMVESFSQQMKVICERYSKPHYLPLPPVQRQSNPTLVINILIFVLPSSTNEDEV